MAIEKIGGIKKSKDKREREKERKTNLKKKNELITDKRMRKIKDEGDEKFYNCDFIMIYCEKR